MFKGLSRGNFIIDEQTYTLKTRDNNGDIKKKEASRWRELPQHDVSHALTFFVPPSVLSTNHQTVKNSTNLLMSVLVAMNRKNAGKIMLIMPPIELIQRINVTYEILIKASECHQKH